MFKYNIDTSKIIKSFKCLGLFFRMYSMYAINLDMMTLHFWPGSSDKEKLIVSKYIFASVKEIIKNV